MSIRLRIISEMPRIAGEQRVALRTRDGDLSLDDATFSLAAGDFVRASENVSA